MTRKWSSYPLAMFLSMSSIVVVGGAAMAVTTPSANSITSCSIYEGGVDKGSNYSITVNAGVVAGTQPLISIVANDATKYTGFEQGYVLKTDPTGTLLTGSQSINVFSIATITNFDLTWYVDSQKFGASNTSYPATTHGFQYRLFAVEDAAPGPYAYSSSDTPLCTLTYYITPSSPVVTAGTATGGTAIATDGNSDGVWDLVATPDSGYIFTSWSCDNSQTPTSTSSASTTITPTASTTCTPVFSVQSGINHGHSDKTAGSGDRSRGDYSSSPPSGQKPRKN